MYQLNIAIAIIRAMDFEISVADEWVVTWSQVDD